MSVNVGTAIAYLQLDATAFNTGLANAQSALGEWQTGLSRGLTTAGSVLTGTGTALTAGLTVPLVNAAKSAVTFGAEFDKQMSAVRAVMGDISDEEFEKLRQTAIDWGEKTVYTATEAGEALYYMGLAGWDAEQAINGLGSVLNLAAAGQMDLGRASDVVTDSMTAMNLSAGQYTNGIENTAYYTSVLAAVMANSNTDIDMLGESFKYVAPIAGQLGYTIEDLGLALGLSANAGIKSSQAGTSLRQALKQLISPTDKTAAAMEKYGISLFDAQGQALPFREIMLQLQKTFGDLGVEVIDANGELKEGEAVMEEYANSLPISQQEKLQAVVDLFGTRAMPTMLAIIQQAGGEFDKLADAIDDAAKTGEYASEMAHTQMDNLAGDWTRFTSALGTTKIMLKDLVDGWLRDFVQRLTELIQKFNDLSDAQKMNVLRWGAIIAGIGPVMTIFGRIMTTVGQLMPIFSIIGEKVAEFTATLTRMKWGWFYSAEEAGGFMSKLAQLGGKLNWIIAIIMLVITAIVDLWKNSEDFRNKVMAIFTQIWDFLKKLWAAIKPVFDELGALWMELARAIEPIIELLVDLLGPALKGLIEFIVPIVQLISQILVVLTKLVTYAVKILAPAIRIIVELLGVILKPLNEIISVLLQIAGDVIGKVVEGLQRLTANWSDYADQMIGIWTYFAGFISNGIKTATSSWVESIQQFADNLIERNTQMWERFLNDTQAWWEDCKKGWEDFWNNIGETARKAGEAISNWFKNAWSEFTRWIEDKWNSFVSDIKSGLDNFVEFVKRIGTSISDNAKKVVEEINNFATQAWNNIKEGFERVKQAIIEGITNCLESLRELGTKLVEGFTNLVLQIKGHFDDIMSRIKEVGSNLVSAFKSAFVKVGEAISNVFENIKNGFISFKDKVAEVASNVGKAFINGLLGTAKSVKDFFVNFITEAINALKEAIPKFFEVGKNIMEKLWEGIKSKWNDFKKWFTDIWNSLLDGTLFKNIGGAVKNFFVNGSHENGLSYVPFNGYVAELHKGERVLTAEENKQYSNGKAVNGGTVINFYSNEKIDEYTAAKELRRTVKDIELGIV